MKSPPQATSDEQLLDDARVVWRAAIARDEATASESEQRLVERDAPFRDRARTRLEVGRPTLLAFACAFAAAIVIAVLGRPSPGEIQAEATALPVPGLASSFMVPVLPSDVPPPTAPVVPAEPAESSASRAARPRPVVAAPSTPAPAVPTPATAPLPPLPPPAPPAPPPDARRPWPPVIVAPPPPRPWPTPPVGSARRAAESATLDAEREPIRKAGVELEKGNVDKARELLRRATQTASEAPAFEAALVLAHTYHEPTEQLAVWESVTPRLGGVPRAHAERERLRLLARLGRRPPTPTVAE